MPFQRIVNAKSALWERAMRQQLRTIAGGGFGLRQQSGQAQLTVRYADGTRSSTNLRILWEPSKAQEEETLQSVLEKQALDPQAWTAHWHTLEEEAFC
ncbi:hypothetical protein [Synechococcus sp. MIT S9503]|uniref:hypothetical protein n=1 Tax=Synechococcus sp. MIT S9503 TaxID=3082547 RepID=UPI0039A65055